MTPTAITVNEIRRLCGDIPDWKIAAIEASGIDIRGLEEAVAWSMGDDENPPRRHLPPESAAARVYEILVAGEEEPESGFD